MTESLDPIVRFYRLIDAAPRPVRADKAAGGTLPARGLRYCDAVVNASAHGWYVFPPMEFFLLFDGEEVMWTHAAAESWMRLDSCQFPHQSDRFDAAAPAHLRGCSPPFMTALPEAGVVQVWTGLIARTAPGWNLLIRPPANLWIGGGYAQYEGIVETDRWFGPLFTNLRITKTDTPIRVRAEAPLLQVQPIHRAAMGEDVMGRMGFVEAMDAFDAGDWADYQRTVVAPNDDPDRPLGSYAVAARKRRKAECPFSARGSAIKAAQGGVIDVGVGAA